MTNFLTLIILFVFKASTLGSVADSQITLESPKTTEMVSTASTEMLDIIEEATETELLNDVTEEQIQLEQTSSVKTTEKTVATESTEIEVIEREEIINDGLTSPEDIELELIDVHDEIGHDISYSVTEDDAPVIDEEPEVGPSPDEAIINEEVIIVEEISDNFSWEPDTESEFSEKEFID